MPRNILFSSSLLLLILAACQPAVEPSSPFDPKAPTTVQAKAVLSATVLRPPVGTETAPMPVPGVVVTALGPDAPDGRDETTDAEGGVSFGALTPGDWTVEVSPTGYLPQSVPLTLGIDTRRNLTVNLVPISKDDVANLGRLEGIALLEAETIRPAAEQDHSRILVEFLDATSGTAVDSTLTSATGDFVASLGIGDYTLRLSAQDHVTLTPTATYTIVAGQVVEPATTLMLLTNPGSVAGTVRLERRGANDYADVIVSSAGGPTTTTAADGSWVLTGVAPGSHIITASLTGYDSESVTVTVAGGRQTAAPDLQLDVSRGRVTGRVDLVGTSDDGAVEVTLTGTSVVARTASDGTFLLEDVFVGTYELAARKDGFSVGLVGSVTATANAETDVGTVSLVPVLGDFQINGGAAYTNDPNVTLSLSATATDMQVSEDSTFTDSALGDTTWQAFAPSPSHTLSGGDGSKTVYVMYRDGAGVVSGPFSATITLDTTPPELARVLIDEGRAYTRDSSGQVNLGLTASDSVSGVEGMRISVDGTFDSETFQSYKVSQVVTVDAPTTDGTKTVYVHYRDYAGNVTTTPASDDIVLDTAPPSLDAPGLTINGGTSYTSGPLVTLAIPSGDAAQMALSNTAGFPGLTWESYASTRAWFLTPGDGGKTVYVRLRDAAGNESTDGSATITLDATGPTGVSLVVTGIVADAASSTSLTSQTNVQLTIAGTDTEGLAGMTVSEDPTFIGATETAFATTRAFTLSAGDGTKTVYLRLRDLAGNVTETLGTIVLDQTAPTAAAASVVQGAETALRIVDLSLFAQGADEVQVGGDVVGGGTWVPFASTLPVTLTDSDGLKSVTVRFRDAAGNETTDVPVSVTLDRGAPSGNTLSITGTPDATTTRTRSVTLTLASTGAAELRLSNDSGLAGAIWQPFATTVAWTLASGDGAQSVYAQTRDSAGNASTVFSDSIQLDTTPPSAPSVVIESGATWSQGSTVSVTFGALGATGMRWSTDGALDTETFVAYAATPQTITLASGEGTRTLLAQFEDAAGNVSAIVFDDVKVDTAAPTGGSVLIEGGAGFTGDALVALSLTATGATQMQVSVDGTIDSESWVPFSETSFAFLQGSDCTAADCKTVQVRFRDDAGWTIGPVSDSITLDTTAPTTPLIITAPRVVDAATTTIDIAGPVVESFFARYEVAGGPVSYPTGFTSVSTTQSDTSFSVDLDPGVAPSGSTDNELRLRAVDQAGNVSAWSTVVITEDSVPPSPPVLLQPADLWTNADTHLLYLSGAVSSLDANFSHFETLRTLAGAPASGAGTATSSLDGLLYALDQGDGTSCASAVPCENDLYVRSVDLAGHTSAWVQRTVYEDSIPPTVPELWPRQATVNTADVAVTLTRPSTDTDFLTYELKGGLYPDYADTTETDRFTFFLKEDWGNILCVRGRDRAGNLGEPDCVTITEQSTRGAATGPFDNQMPRVWGDLMLYTASDPTAGTGELRVRSLASGQETVLVNGNVKYLQIGGQMSRMTAVWTYGGDAWTYERAHYSESVNTRNITTGIAGSVYDVHTDGFAVVFRVFAGGIYRANVTGAAVQIDPGSSLCSEPNPRVHDRTFVWCKNTGNNDIVRYDQNSATLETIASGNPRQEFPAINGTWIAWVEDGVIFKMGKTDAAGSGVSTGRTATRLGNIDGDWVSYVLDIGSDLAEVGMINLSTLQDVSVGAVAGGGVPWVDGHRLFWSGLEGATRQIQVHELNERRYEILDPATVDGMPRIHGDQLTWLQVGAATRVMTLDQTQDTLAGFTVDFSQPLQYGEAGGPYVAIWDGINGLRVRNTETGSWIVVRTAAEMPVYTGRPSVAPDGSAIAWSQWSGTARQVFWSPLPAVSVNQLTSGGSINRDEPDIAAGVVVWSENGKLYCKQTSEGLGTGDGYLINASGGGLSGDQPDVAAGFGAPTRNLIFRDPTATIGVSWCELWPNGGAPFCSTYAVPNLDASATWAPSVASDPHIAPNGMATWQVDAMTRGKQDVALGEMKRGRVWILNSEADPTSDQSAPTLTVRPDGRTSVVWQDARTGNAEIFSATTAE